MIDAYKIGITLALNDEVSTGLAEIQRNLAVTDQTVTHAAESLAYFQTLGRTTVEPTTAIRSVLDASYRAPVVDREQADMTPGSVDAFPVWANASMLNVTQPVGRRLPAPAPVKEAAALQEPHSAVPDWSNFANLATRAMPPCAPESEFAAAHLSSFPNPPVIQPFILNETAADQFSAIAQKETLPASFEATQSDAHSALLRDPVPQEPTQNSEILVQDIAGISPSPRLRTLTEQDGVDVPVAKPTVQEHLPDYRNPVWVPPSIPRQESASMAQPRALTNTVAASDASIVGSLGKTHEIEQGQLILDGTSLGRWIMDRIAREMIKPPAGMTGFDTRITPLYSGPAIGV